jgi:hypothetical protein
MNQLQQERIVAETSAEAVLYARMIPALPYVQTAAQELRELVEEERANRLCFKVVSVDTPKEEIDKWANQVHRKLSRSLDNKLVNLYQRRENRRIRHIVRKYLRYV